LEIRSQIRHVIIAGRDVPLDNSQVELSMVIAAPDPADNRVDRSGGAHEQDSRGSTYGGAHRSHSRPLRPRPARDASDQPRMSDLTVMSP